MKDKVFPILYKQCFGIASPKIFPPIMVAAYNDKIVWGFSSGFGFNDAVFYVNASGIIPEYRTKKNAVKLEKEAEKIYKTLGFLNVTAHIENINKRALVTALMSGYTVTGSILGRDGKTLVIVSKEI